MSYTQPGSLTANASWQGAAPYILLSANSANASWGIPPTTSPSATVKAYTPTGWVAGVLKQWDGVAWETANLHVRTSSGWV